MWKYRKIEGKIKSGNFSQDARGRWCYNVVCEVERSSTNRTVVSRINLGQKTTAKSSHSEELFIARFYRAMEKKLARAQRRGQPRLAKTINAKFANREKDVYDSSPVRS